MSASKPTTTTTTASRAAASSGPGVGSIVIWRGADGLEAPAIVLSAHDSPDGPILVAAGVARGASGRLEFWELSGAEADDDGPGWRER